MPNKEVEKFYPQTPEPFQVTEYGVVPMKVEDDEGNPMLFWPKTAIQKGAAVQAGIPESFLTSQRVQASPESITEPAATKKATRLLGRREVNQEAELSDVSVVPSEQLPAEESTEKNDNKRSFKRKLARKALFYVTPRLVAGVLVYSGATKVLGTDDPFVEQLKADYTIENLFDGPQAIINGAQMIAGLRK